jgi:DNA-binding NarL/FixJ family response regulator
MSDYVSRYVKVFLQDDHDIVRQGLRDLLSAATDIHVVGDSASARQAPKLILELQADVMVLDLQLQDGTGIEVCRAVRSVNPSVSGLLLTSSGDDEALVSAILAGAAGYVVKLTRTGDFVAAIRRVATGRSLIDPATAERVTRQIMTVLDEFHPALTEYEREVLAHVAGGLTNHQVAERMGMSLERVATDITALVARMPGAVAGQRSVSDPAPGGKHRRTGG